MISVIIPTKNNACTVKYSVKSVLESLSELDLPWEVVIVDAHSTDGTVDAVLKVMKEKGLENRLRVLYDEGRGIGAARNLGVKESRGDIIFFVDADCLVEKNHFRKLLENLRGKVGLVWTSGVWMRFPVSRKNGFLKIMNSHVKIYSIIEEPEKEGTTYIASTALSCVSRKVFNEVGGFWEFPFASEDMDFSYRVIKKGYEIRKVKTRSIALPRSSLLDMIKQQIWYGRGSSVIYYLYGKEEMFWKIHGWGFLHKLGFPLNYVALILGTVISAFIFAPITLLFSPSLSIKKKSFVKLDLTSRILFEFIDRMAYAWGFLTGLFMSIRAVKKRKSVDIGEFNEN